MVKHIVMWKLKETAEGASAAENGAKMKTMLEELSSLIPVVKHLEVAVAPFAANPECDVVLYSEFASKEDLDAYQVHPEHQRCVAFVKNVVSERRLLDYEI